MNNTKISHKTYVQEASVLMRLLSDGVLTTDEYTDIMGRAQTYYNEHKQENSESKNTA